MTSHSSTLLQHRPFIRYEAQYGIVICLTCNQGYQTGSIRRHLVEKHGIAHKVYHSVLQSFEQQYPLSLAQSWKSISLPVDRSVSIEGLRILPGYHCGKCGLKTTNDNTAKKHQKKCSRLNQVSLQCWNVTKDNRYWVVLSTPTALAESAFASHGLPSF